MAETTPTAETSFEAALKRLEEIVQRLERGQEPLDGAIELFAEGDQLRRQCEERLKAAEAKIEQIVMNKDGGIATAPFAEG